MEKITREIAAYLRESCPEYAGLADEELLMMQESALYHIQNQGAGVAFSQYGGSRSGYMMDQQLACDEALARALQLGADFSGLEICGHGSSSRETQTGVDDDEAVARALANEFERDVHGPTFQGDGHNTIVEDDIDPDRMTYEELNSLGDALGKESKGVSVETISQLPTFKFKHKFGGGSSHSKKNKTEAEECVICCSKYEKNDKLIALPCAHRYHSDCITTWLKDHKNCPVCQKDIE